MKFWINSSLNSYSILFFSLNKVLGIAILIVTFITPVLGICGLAAILLTNFLAYLANCYHSEIEEGTYGYNALLLGLYLGYEFKVNAPFIILFVTACLLLLLFTIVFKTFLAKYQLPFLSLPFLLTYWLIYLAVGSFSLIHLQEQYIFVQNYLANSSKSQWYIFAHSLDGMEIPILIKSYLKTLSATFFQNSILAGILIAGSLLFFSRITFTLSLLGYFGAFCVFKLLGINTLLLTDYLVGSNFIFFAIAVGGFYVVPNKWSYFLVILLLPVLCVFLISLGKIMAVFQLKSFTLSFSLLTITFLLFLNQGLWQKLVQLVTIQYFNAEKTIYKHLNVTQRFKFAHLAKLSLPFMGEWKVSQGYDGSITHLGEWSKALDFVVTNEEDKTYEKSGTKLNHFYCYNKPILAPLEGYVYDIINTVEDNEINQVDTKNNWGNTIVINHQNGLFSQISHIKKDSFKVAIGDYVQRGDILASCGNSGRSPEPHIHFQNQLSGIIGEKTYPYPIAYYLEKMGGKQFLMSYKVPNENSIISNITVSELLKNAFDFQPGKVLKLANGNEVVNWEIYTDSINRSYFYCEKTKSKLWFAQDNLMFYSYDFDGDKKSLLFQFYLSYYKIMLSSIEGVRVDDHFPVSDLSNILILTIQDFIAPFYRFLSADFQSYCSGVDSAINPKLIEIVSSAKASIFKKKLKQTNYHTILSEGKPMHWTINNSRTKQVWQCEIY